MARGEKVWLDSAFCVVDSSTPVHCVCYEAMLQPLGKVATLVQARKRNHEQKLFESAWCSHFIGPQSAHSQTSLKLLQVWPDRLCVPWRSAAATGAGRPGSRLQSAHPLRQPGHAWQSNRAGNTSAVIHRDSSGVTSVENALHLVCQVIFNIESVDI